MMCDNGKIKLLKSNNKGFTLVELIITLAIAAIILGIVMTFFITNIKSSNIITDKTELQYQAQNVMNFITEKAMQSSGISKVYIKDGNSYLPQDMSIQEVSNVGYIGFIVEGVKHIFVLDRGNIYYSDSISDLNIIKNNKYILGKWLTNINIKSNSAGADLSSTNSIEITLEFEKNDAKVTLSNIVYMRNKH